MFFLIPVGCDDQLKPVQNEDSRGTNITAIFFDMGLIWTLIFQALLYTHAFLALRVYKPVREYAGAGFFSEWDYYGNTDNTTWGNVSYVDRDTGVQEKLTFVDPMTGHTIIRVDNTTNIEVGTSSTLRKSVKITSKDVYPIGSLIVIDAIHIPYGCSVSPAFRTLGTGLEIGLIGGMNGMMANNMVMHTDPGCVQSLGVDQSGKTLATDCNSDMGCKVEEMRPDSYGEGFAKAGGGVFALKMDAEGVFMWFWSRRDIPGSLPQSGSHSSMDISDWGKPSAAYPVAGCDIERFFKLQKLVLDIALCGQWAGLPESYAETCTGDCISNVFGDGSNYATAYWEISYIRAFSLKGPDSSLLAGDPPATPNISSTSTTAVEASSPSSPYTPSTPPPTISITSHPAASLTSEDHPTIISESETLTRQTATSSANLNGYEGFNTGPLLMLPSSFLIFDPSIPASPSDAPVSTVGLAPITTASVEDSDMNPTTTVIQASSYLVMTIPITVSTGAKVISTIDVTNRSQSAWSSSASALLDTVHTTGVHFTILVSFLLLC
ncbi:hypothetical protein VNI00_010927 [Paramarasmius palmivorus]|uniref:GH16 domain-containing protein n=1 Tax=Paramarasmius palmivorus TaxID=297713 RepID=A0AAW0CFD6_9AGAR